jgi:hypothetical protein
MSAEWTGSGLVAGRRDCPGADGGESNVVIVISVVLAIPERSEVGGGTCDRLVRSFEYEKPCKRCLHL